ncbi:hypothetical protein PV326_009411, partial [Microctonus aethiopoides]
YNWVKYNTNIVINPGLMEFRKESNSFHGLGRLIYDNGDILPGEMEILFTNLSNIDFFYIPHKGYKTLEVLLIDSGTTKWVESSNGVIENNAIKGGKKENEIIYVCRIYINKNPVVGWMQPSKRSCYVARKPNSPRKVYEILTMQIE